MEQLEKNPELNPEVESVPVPRPDAVIAPEAPDFVETPDVVPAPPAEPEPLPVWLYVVCCVALFLAGSSFTGFAGFGLGLYDQGPGSGQVAGAVNGANSPKSQVAASPLDLGKRIYGGKCANCHQASGAGQPGSYPPMAGSEYVLGPKEPLIAIMLNGLEGHLTVKGGEYGTQQMPGWATSLSDKNIADVLTYLRQSWGNGGDAVSEDDVKAARAKYGTKSGAWSEGDLKAIK